MCHNSIRLSSESDKKYFDLVFYPEIYKEKHPTSCFTTTLTPTTTLLSFPMFVTKIDLSFVQSNLFEFYPFDIERIIKMNTQFFFLHSSYS